MGQCYFHLNIMIMIIKLMYFSSNNYRRRKSHQSGIYDEIKASNIDLSNDDQGEKNIYDIPQRKRSIPGATYENLPHDQQKKKSFQSNTASRDGQRKGSFQASGDRRRKRSFQSGIYEEVKESDNGEYQNLPCHSNPSYGESLQLATTETSEKMDNIYELPVDSAA